ncbi:hypothetical protein PsYK624_039750 [Phanerochaete sordida]|uniref:Uncharacterized protein n=1 Tax=Phanerochaete sordida TaxID=48140 RepID=A0A9P3G429_9APHY|nr:hypothetical protein PsYK624_039750 [Phanerochaete sordida]
MTGLPRCPGNDQTSRSAQDIITKSSIVMSGNATIAPKSMAATASPSNPKSAVAVRARRASLFRSSRHRQERLGMPRELQGHRSGPSKRSSSLLPRR